MKRFLLSLCILLEASLAAAQAPRPYVYVTAIVSTTSTSAIATGGAQYHYANGSEGTVGISGFLSLYEDSVTVNDMPYTGFNGRWVGSFTYQGYVGNCYQAGINGHGVDTDVNVAYSNTACIAGRYDPPPYQHGYDICPLILDLDADGIPTTGLENAVTFFDTNRDGVREASGWTAPYAHDAFLWTDLNGNGVADPGELFGAGMPLPSGGYARNGFEALRAFDSAQAGGNGDGLITRSDAIWDSLRLWVDVNHDGRSDPREISTPGAEHIVSFDLADVPVHRMDPLGNVVMYFGWFDLRVHEPGSQPHVEHRRIADISFIPAMHP
jgi:hypothetical protein